MTTKTIPSFTQPVVQSGARWSTQHEIRRRAAKAANGFRSLGVGEGDTVALVLRNDIAFFEASLGATRAGAYPVPINWHSTAEEAGYVVRDCGAKVLVVHEDLLSEISAGMPIDLRVLVVSTPPEIRQAYRLGNWPTTKLSTQSWDDWLEPFAEAEALQTASRSAVIYTSGTTGRPKGVRRAPSAPAPPSNDPPPGSLAFGLDGHRPMRVLMNGPMYHSAPNAYGSIALQMGASLFLQPRFDAEEMLALIEQHQITHMHIVPTMFVRLLKLPSDVRGRYDLSSLRSVVHGAAPCPPEVKHAMIEWWGPVISEYYGSSETGLVAWHNSEDALHKPGTVGRALPNATIKIFDGDGQELGPGQVGEIYLRSWALPDFTYIGQEEKRREVGRGDLVTVGDIGYLDEDGFLFLCDRKRDMIISGGVNIYPAEIETVLITLPGVSDCAVFGVPDAEFGEAVYAYVEPMDGAMLDPDDLKSELAKQISRFKVPKVVKIVETLPREDSGKIFKRKLREPYWRGLARSI